jgi:hypothetical protein
MEKILILLFMTMLPNSGWAAVGFHCVPSMRDSRLQVLVLAETVEVFVVNPMGYEFMPQFDGPSSVFTQKFNNMQGEDLKALGDSFRFVWRKEDCKVDTSLLTVNCHAPSLNKVQTVTSYGLSTTEITEKYEGEISNKRKFRFAVEKENIYFLNLLYDVNNCAIFAP